MNGFDQPPALWRLRPQRRFVVGAEVDAAAGPRAHAVGDVGSLTARHGIALCGLPVEELVIVPNLDWSSVDPASRCAPCQEAYPHGS